MVRFLACAVLGGGLSFLSCAGAFAQRVDIQERIEFYGIQGRTPEQLVREMQTKGPPSAFGGPGYFARAEQYFTWDLSFDVDDGVCEIDSYSVNVDMLYTLPKWTDQERGRSRLVKYWEQFEKNVFTHEQGHGDIALEVGVDISKAIAAIGPAETCDELISQAEPSIEAVMKNANARQRSYDKETQHGKTQGAFFDIGAAKGRRRR